MRGRSFFREPACLDEEVLDFRLEQKDGAALCIMASRKTIKKGNTPFMSKYIIA